MPELDGYATARLVRQLDSAACGVPIIALTANALHGDRERCLDAGMNDYVKKPFLLSELRQKVLRWLDRDPMESIRPSPSEVADPVIERLAVVDMTRLNELAQQAGTDSIVIELSQIFLEDIATRLQVLRAAYHDGKLLQFQRTAHTIKGAAGNFGAARLAAIAGALEAAADFDQDTARRVEQACVEFETVRARLEAEVFGHGPRSRPAPAASLSTPNPPARAGAS
jgi:CheY-like chemotaxis protein